VNTIPDVRLKQAPLIDPQFDTFLLPESFFFFPPSSAVGPYFEKLDMDARNATFHPRWMCEKLTNGNPHTIIRERR
jgi:hypothetical protein